MIYSHRPIKVPLPWQNPVIRAGEDQEQDNKNERFKELEWLIKQRLLKQYERMETADYLEDNSD